MSGDIPGAEIPRSASRNGPARTALRRPRSTRRRPSPVPRAGPSTRAADRRCRCWLRPYREIAPQAPGRARPAQRWRHRHPGASPSTPRRTARHARPNPAGYRQGDDTGIVRLSGAGREHRYGVGDAVVGVRQHQTAAMPGDELRHAPRHVIRLAAGIDEDAGVEVRGAGRQQRVGIVEDPAMQISRVRREHGDLPLNGAYHGGVTMPDVGHIVVDVEMSAPLNRRTTRRRRREPDAAVGQ